MFLGTCPRCRSGGSLTRTMTTGNSFPGAFRPPRALSSPPCRGTRPGRRERAWRGLRRIALALLVAGPGWAATAASSPSVLGMRMFDASSHTRVVFDLSAPVDYNLFSLRKPDRVVLDLKGVRFRRS